MHNMNIDIKGNKWCPQYLGHENLTSILMGASEDEEALIFNNSCTRFVFGLMTENIKIEF